ncbi:MAG TPA: ATP synthase F0 subunit B [Bryobacteraceae bacterium]|nr:ATP synthase F0 subunit B [Bryobacteraceae bacterium]
MKQPIFAIAMAGLLLGVPSVLSAEEKKSGSESGGHGELKAWEWANFILLAGGLGYIIGKNAGPAFEARGRRIRKDMVEAEEAKKEADSRVAAVEQRLAHLADEIAALRDEALREEESEHARYARHIAAEIAKIQAHAEQEIAAAGKAARMELKRYAAQIALGLAEQKIRSRMTPEIEDRLVRGFVSNLESPPSSAQAG